MTFAYKLPRRFELFDRQFTHDNVFAWYGRFEDENILVCITETEGSYYDEDLDEDEPYYLCTVYHHDEIIGEGQGTSPLLSCLNASLTDFLDAADTMNAFLKTLTKK